jgi:acyl-CoA synthetase (AMP-forming)/AMP-acid ligase II
LRRAAERPLDPAFWFHRHGRVATVTWQELVTGARRYCAAFREQGVQPGEIVIILLDHAIDQYFAFAGALLAGAVPSFMPALTNKQIPELYWSSHRKLFERIRPRVLVISDDRVRQLRDYIPTEALAVLTPETAARSEADPTPPHPAALDDIAFLQHSSGTTQLKKGVQLSHRAVLAQVATYGGLLGLGEGDRIASWLPLYHDMGLIACYITPLVTGIPVAALDPFEWVAQPDLLLRAIETYRTTLTWLPNFAFHHLLRTRQPGTQYDLSSVRAWIDCSEPCRTSTFDVFFEGFADCGVARDRLQVCYAMAETVFAVSQTTLGEPVRRLRIDAARLQKAGEVVPVPSAAEGLNLLSAGKVLPGLSIAIVDEAGRPLPPGRAGEVTVRGDFVFSGYYKLPEQTAVKFTDGVYRTSDLGFVWDGELFVLGRMDDLVIINGRNFFSHEVEHVVSTIPGLKPGRNVLFAVDEAAAGTQGAVLVSECDALDPAASAQLKRRIRQAVMSECDLSLHEILLAPPGWIVKTTSGKISRLENRAKYLAARTA